MEQSLCKRRRCTRYNDFPDIRISGRTEEMFLKQALVTGANGFLGSHLVRHLVAHGVAVTAIDREGCNDRLPQNPLVRFVPCDLKDILQLGTKICPTKPDTFYHLAWQGV